MGYTAVLVHDNFTGPTGMGVVVGRHARWLLDAGWTLTLVGDNVPPDLAAAARVVSVQAPRHVPSLVEHVAWCTRVRRALHGLRADIVHVHSPLLAAEADLVTSHFMAYPSHARGARELSRGAAGALRRIQAYASRVLDHRAYAELRTRTYLSFVSEFLRDEFHRWYGSPRGGWVLAPPAPAWRPVDELERAHARSDFGIGARTLLVGYLGGNDPRKGWMHLAQLQACRDFTLVMAGPGSQQLELAGRRGIGVVDVDVFHAACDVVVAPAVFDSAPVAVLQAIARDVPVVTTRWCGWARAIESTGAGVVWQEPEALEVAIRRAVGESASEHRRAFLAEFADEKQSQCLLSAYGEVVATRT